MEEAQELAAASNHCKLFSHCKNIFLSPRFACGDLVAGEQKTVGIHSYSSARLSHMRLV